MWYIILLAGILFVCVLGTVLLIVYYYWGPKGPPGK
jgi:hypothetical protein